MHRRDFLRVAAQSAGAAAVLGFTTRGQPSAGSRENPEVRKHLRAIMPSRERVVHFTEVMTPEESRRRSNGWTYHAELGWVHCSAVHPNGVDDSRTFYNYESDGARRVIHSADQPCRLHAFGNSFTHCDQVNDGETWEEYLAAHLQEPVRNYGVGGYSVYQAYRRMLLVEKLNPAPYLILNIYDDDHYRNLDAWRSIRAGAKSQCGFTLPHLRVNVEQGRCEQIENRLRPASEVAKLREENFIVPTFQDDPVLHLMLAMQAGGDADTKTVNAVAARFGVAAEKLGPGTAAQQLRQVHTEAALFASKHVVTWFEQQAANAGQKLLVVLSFSSGNIANELSGRPRFDQGFVEWLRAKSYPVIDMRDVFRQEYRESKADLKSFLAHFYHGHHTPAGNFFTAWAIKDRIVKWLDPAPRPYRP